jgi:putative membrane protein
MAAGQSDMYEIESSRIALQKAQNPAVKRFASMLIKHHTKTTAATMKAAQKAGMTPPPPTLPPGAAASISELQNAPAANFDHIYLGQQVPAHQAALDLHQSYSTAGDQRPLMASAKSAVPIVRQHLETATKMHGGNMAGHRM